MTEYLAPGVGLALAVALATTGIVLWRKPRATAQPGLEVIGVPEQLDAQGTAATAIEEESIVLDPVAMNITNRITAGSHQSGVISCRGGLWVEGTIEGEVHVSGGPLVLMQSGVITGRIVGDGDAYLLGTIRSKTPEELSELDVLGAAFLTKHLRAQANITAGAIKTYEGSQVEGRIKTVRRAAR